MTSMDGPVAQDSDVRQSASGEPVPVTTFTARQRCCTRMGCFKYGLFVINFVVWAAGGVLIGVGTWSRLQPYTTAAFDDVTVDVAYLLMGVGAVMVVVSLLGCVGALRNSFCLLKVFVVVVVVVFVGQMVAGVLAFVLLDTVEARMMDVLRHAILHYHTPQQHTMDQALDSLQAEYSCCGAASYRDWEASDVYNCSSPSPWACAVPPSCCLRQELNCAKDARRHTEMFAKAKIHTRGCIGALMSVFKSNLIVVGLIAFAVGFLQVCSLLMAHCLMRYLVSDGKFTL